MSPTTIPYNPKSAAFDAIDIIPNVQSIVKTCHEKNIPIFWTQHGHRNIELDGGSLSRWWGDKMIKWGTFEWKILKELQPMGLFELSTSLGIETLIISGVRTNLCCEMTARRGFDKNFDIVFLKDATATESQMMQELTQ